MTDSDSNTTSPSTDTATAATFDGLNLHENLLRAVHEQGYTTPTPIQAKAIPAILNGDDVMAAAQTGTGKTAGFTLPILDRLSDLPYPLPKHTHALILTPTRELAAQVHDSVKAYGKYMQLDSACVYGGVKINPQIAALEPGVDVLVATPGRLLDLYEQQAVYFEHVETLVLDEADRMLDMGFIKDIKRIISLLPKNRQNLMFSATFSYDIRNLAKGLMNHPLEIDVAPRNTATELAIQTIHPVDKAQKAHLLSHLIRNNNWFQVLVFCRTKHGANKLAYLLERDRIKTGAIHGDKSQPQRMKALEDFKKGKLQVLVATDIAARGIDIDQLPYVVNYDLPDSPEDYVHRIGRTGRAGATGNAISLVSLDEFVKLRDIEKLIKREIAREVVQDFEPTFTLPASGGTPGQPASPRGRGGHRARSSHGGLGSSASSDGKRWGR